MRAIPTWKPGLRALTGGDRGGATRTTRASFGTAGFIGASTRPDPRAGWAGTCPAPKGRPFSAVVEDCVGIGRFAGACAIAHSPRPDEPVVFRRCYFLNLDWWGDAGGVYVRGESASLPQDPHAVFEDCTIVGPDNALQAGYPGVDDLFTRVKFTRCRLIVLNFSQPHGTPSSGIVCCGCKDGSQLHVEFEDCDVMGFKVFGTRKGDVSYTTKGRCTAYVQYRSPVPDGFERLRFWPVAVFRRSHAAALSRADRLGSRRTRVGQTALRNGRRDGEHAHRLPGPSDARSQSPRRHEEQDRRLHARACICSCATL